MSELLPAALDDCTILCLQAGEVNTGEFDPFASIIPVARAAGEIGIGLGVGHGGHFAFDPHLHPAAHARPVEQQRGMRIGVDFLALAALGVGVEHEPVGPVAFEQHHANRRGPVGRGGGERHRVGVVRLGLRRLGEPVAEQRNRVAVRDRFLFGLHAKNPRMVPMVAVPMRFAPVRLSECGAHPAHEAILDDMQRRWQNEGM